MLRAAWPAAAVLLCVAGCASLEKGPRSPPAIWPTDVPDRIELSSVPFHPQADYQCGPAALATVLGAAGVVVAPAALVADVYIPGRKGSLQAEMLAAARGRDRLAYVMEPSFGALVREVAAGHPALVLLNLGVDKVPLWHYAVVLGFDRATDRLWLRSGSTERLGMSRARFDAAWQRADRWAVLVLASESIPVTATLERFMQAAADLEQTGRLAPAQAAYLSAAARWPESPLPGVGLANVLATRGDYAGAESALRAAIAAAPGDVPARNNLAELLSKRGCYAAARAEIDEALRLAANGPFAAAVADTAREIEARSAAAVLGRCP